MSLTNTTVKLQYDGDGATTSFSVTFPFWDSDDLQVVHRDSSDTETTWTRGTQYTVTGGSGSTGSVEVETSPTDYTPASGETLTITSNLSFTQPTSLPAGGPVPTSPLEQQLDQIVRQIQQRGEQLDRSLHLPITDSTSRTTEIPNSTDRASKFLGFDKNGDPVASDGTSTSEIAQAIIENKTTIALAVTTENGVVVTGTGLTSWHFPFDFNVTEVQASLSGGTTTGTITVDINVGGSTILSTKLTIDATELTSVTAATAAVISTAAASKGDRITVDVDGAGDGTATGLKVAILGDPT